MENRANASAGQITTPVIDGLVKPNHLESSKQGNGAGEEASVEAQLYHEVCILLDAGKHAEARQFFTDHLNLILQGGDVSYLNQKMAASALRRCVSSYVLLFDPENAIDEESAEEQKEKSLVDLLSFVENFYDCSSSRKGAEEEAAEEGASSSVFFADTHFYLKRLAYQFSLNRLLLMVDPRSQISSQGLRFKRVPMEADYTRYVQLRSEQVFAAFLDQDLSGGAFAGEPSSTISELTTKLFLPKPGPHGRVEIDPLRLASVCKAHSGQKLVFWTEEYLRRHGPDSKIKYGEEKEEEEEEEEEEVEEDAGDEQKEDEQPSQSSAPRVTFDSDPEKEYASAEEDYGPPAYGDDDYHEPSPDDKLPSLAPIPVWDSGLSDSGEEDQGDDDDDDGGGVGGGGSRKRLRAWGGRPRPRQADATSRAGWIPLLPQENTPPQTPAPPQYIKRRPWTDDEIRILLSGMKKHHLDKQIWSKIKRDDTEGADVLSKRSNVDLKDKYRQLRDCRTFDFTTLSSRLDTTPRKRKH